MDWPPKSLTDYSIGDGGGPDLRKLVEAYGSYSKIPAEEWTNYDAALSNTHFRVAYLHTQLKRKKSDLANGG